MGSPNRLAAADSPVHDAGGGVWQETFDATDAGRPLPRVASCEPHGVFLLLDRADHLIMGIDELANAFLLELGRHRFRVDADRARPLERRARTGKIVLDGDA